MAAAVDPALGSDYAVAERALQGGRVEVAVKALERAASQNNLQAQLKLGHLYREGKYVKQDDARACRLFSEAADGHTNFDPKHPAARSVGEAFLYWGECYAKGVPALGWEQNITTAARMYYQAGTIFGDAQALYKLAMLHMSGLGVSKNVRLGQNYLFSASRKRYAPAQARLGFLLWEGKLIKRNAGPGLALLDVAKDNADSEDRSWINSLSSLARSAATEGDIAEMEKVIGQYREAYKQPPARVNIPLPQRAPGLSVPGSEEQNQFRSLPTDVKGTPEQ